MTAPADFDEDGEFERRIWASDGELVPLHLAPELDGFAKLARETLADVRATVRWIEDQSGATERTAIGFLEGSYWNAHTGSHGEDVVGVRWGVVVASLILFHRLLAQPKVFPSVGDASGEEAFVDPPGVLEPDTLAVVGASLRVPNDPELLRIAQYMFSKAILYVFLHELFHVWDGHTGLDKKALSPIDLQTLEMDADAQAIDRLLQLARFETNGAQPREPVESKFGPGATVAFDTLSSAYLAWRFHHSAITHSLARTGGNHPPLAHRMGICLYTAATTLVLRWGFSPEDAGEFATSVLRSAEEAYATLTGVPYDPSIMDIAFGPVGHDYRAELLAKWHRVRPTLKPRFGTLAPLQTIYDSKGNLLAQA